MPKPEILPLNIALLKGSSAWKWLPHVFGWYMKLLIEMAVSEKVGYLPNDPERLCNLANSWDDDASRPRNWRDISAKFLWAWDSLLAAKFITTADRLWIYHPRLQESLKQPKTQGERGSGVVFDLVSTTQLQKLFEEGYKYYPHHKKPRDSEKAFFQAVSRLAKKRSIPAIQAAEFIVAQCLEFASSPAGKRGKYTPLMGTWLRADSFLEDSSEWQAQEEKKPNERTTKNQQVIADVFRNMGDDDSGSDAETMAKSRTVPSRSDRMERLPSGVERAVRAGSNGQGHTADTARIRLLAGKVGY